MQRPLVVDVSKDLPARAREVSPHAAGQVFGGCVAAGGACTSTSDCCPANVPPGDYVLCYFYRGHGIVSGYCTRASWVYG